MTKKIILTQEQAKAIECVKSDTYWSLDSFLNSHARNESSGGSELWTHEYHPLNKLSVSELAKALFIGYEIEPEKPKFQPGDKLYSPLKGIFNVTEIKNEMIFVKELPYPLDLALGSHRRATPEEIYWLETLGREKVGDFRENDTFVGHDRSFFILNEIDIEDAQIWYKDGALKGIYPAESFKPFPKEDTQ